MSPETRFWRSRRKRTGVALLISMALLAAGCGRKKPVRTPAAPVPGSVEFGLASWYGNPYHGRRAANGEIYDMEKFTAAHRTLPFGTWVEVMSLANNKRVRVRITDRGPFVEGRIIDLSRAAARRIAMLGAGTAKVRVQVTAGPEAAPAGDLFAVQAGAFQDRSNAERLERTLKKRYGECRIVLREGQPRVFRVLVGREPTIEHANALADQLRAETGAAFVVRLDETAADSL